MARRTTAPAASTAFGEGVYNAQGGGSGDVVHCSNVILDSMPPTPYSVVDFLQR